MKAFAIPIFVSFHLNATHLLLNEIYRLKIQKFALFNWLKLCATRFGYIYFYCLFDCLVAGKARKFPEFLTNRASFNALIT